jgi:hypothetical protein
MENRRRLLVVLAAAVAAYTGAVSTSVAATTPYWGFNQMTSSNPGPSDCGDPFAWSNPKACSGFNYWDRTQIDKRNGGNVWLGFAWRDAFNNWFTFETLQGGIGVFSYSRTGWNNDYGAGIPQYNKVWCDYGGGDSSYAQCQGVVF